MLGDFVRATGVDAVGVDSGSDMAIGGGDVPPADVAVQGNLDPLALVAGGQAMADEAHGDPDAMRGRPFIFNLGHGIVPQTPTGACARHCWSWCVPDSVLPRVAIVLFNLGGPDRPEAIRPFLLNLFRDPAILRVPFFVRPLLARWIARARVAPATANYALLGGKSPLLDDPGSRPPRWKALAARRRSMQMLHRDALLASVQLWRRRVR